MSGGGLKEAGNIFEGTLRTRMFLPQQRVWNLIVVHAPSFHRSYEGAILVHMEATPPSNAELRQIYPLLKGAP